MVIPILDEQSAVDFLQVPGWCSLAPVSRGHDADIGLTSGGIQRIFCNGGRGNDLNKLRVNDVG